MPKFGLSGVFVLFFIFVLGIWVLVIYVDFAKGRVKLVKECGFLIWVCVAVCPVLVLLVGFAEIASCRGES